jgi:hypothetical protein
MAFFSLPRREGSLILQERRVWRDAPKAPKTESKVLRAPRAANFWEKRARGRAAPQKP